MEKTAVSDKGNRRTNNQDYHFMDPLNRYSILADGMGGHSGGEMASYAAVTTAHGILKNFNAENIEQVEKKLAEVFKKANDAVYGKSLANPALTGMGTTLIISYLFDGYLVVAHAGDSRAYLFSNDRMERLTKDHSLVQQMIESGELTPEESRNHPKRNIITKAVGTEPSICPDISTRKLEEGGERLIIMCTDGLTDFVTDNEIADICRIESSLHDRIRRMLDLALNHGGLDNISITAIRINETSGSVKQ